MIKKEKRKRKTISIDFNPLSASSISPIKLKSITLNQPNSIFSSAISTGGFLSLPDFKDGIKVSTILPADESEIKLNNQIYDLTMQIDNLVKELQQVKENRDELKKINKKITEKNSLLIDSTKLRDLSTRMHKKASNKLLTDITFQKLFFQDKCDAVVLSIDIRRSTELMLKIRQPEDFAGFISALCLKLKNIIISNYGIFDKFTGDGILAYFPDFYSGSNAMGFALKSAFECHEYFNQFYRKNRDLFSVVISEIGLGIGIDFDQAYIVDINNVLTLIGSPVVYACRLSNSHENVGKTLLNQQAYKESINTFKDYCKFEEEEIKIKNEGKIFTYRIEKFDLTKIKLKEPNWI